MVGVVGLSLEVTGGDRRPSPDGMALVRRGVWRENRVLTSRCGGIPYGEANCHLLMSSQTTGQDIGCVFVGVGMTICV